MIALDPIIVKTRLSGTQSVLVEFTSPHTDKLHQLYIGRSLAAVTSGPTQRFLEAQLTPSLYPQWLSVVAVDASDVTHDRGAWLPPRPYNVVRILFNQSGWSGNPHETDVRKFTLHRGAVPGGAIDYTGSIDTVLSEPNAPNYILETDPLPGSGEWPLGIRGVDTTESTGNPGIAVERTVSVTSIPPDFATPFAVSVTAGTATVTTILPVD